MRLTVSLALLCLLLTQSAKADYLTDFTARADLLIDWVADTYQPPGGSNPYNDGGISDPEKYTGPKMLARFAKYGPTDTDGAPRGDLPYPPVNTNANTWFDEGAKDRNFFHFRFVAPAAIIWKFPTAPAVVDHTVTYLGGNSDPEIQKDFVFKRDDNYNAFTGEGTENHISMNRTSGWLFAAKAAKLYDANPGLYPHFATAAARQSDMRQWIFDWSKRVYEVGFGEWDSATYTMFNVMGWLQIYDCAGPDTIDDPEVRAAAKAVLDLYAGSLALKRTQGQVGGSESRANRKYDRLNDGTAYLSWLWFAEGTTAPPEWRGNNPAYAIYAAISDYRPPMAAVELARKQFTTPETYTNTKPSYILREPAQGVEVFHAGPGYTLGSTNLDIGGFSSATWQIVTWKLLSETDGGDYPKLVWGNGGYYGARGNTKDPFDQLVQHENVLIQMSRIPSNASSLTSAVYALYPDWDTDWNTDFQARFTERDYGGWGGGTPINSQAGNLTDALQSHILYDSSATRTTGTGAVFLELNKTYIAIMSIQQALPILSSNGVYDFGADDQLFGLVMEVGSESEHTSMANFTSLIEANLASGALDLSQRDTTLTVTYTALDGDDISATYAHSGTWIEPDYDWSYGVTNAGGVTTMHEHAWQQPPWPNGTGHGRQPTWSINGIAQDPSTWGVYDGPRLKLKNGRLEFFSEATLAYAIDYSGDTPAFEVPSTDLRVRRNGPDLEFYFPAVRSAKSFELRKSGNLSGWSPVDNELIDTSGTDWFVRTPAASLSDPVFYEVEIVP